MNTNQNCRGERMQATGLPRVADLMIGQQIASADSICANREEGHGRRSGKE